MKDRFFHILLIVGFVLIGDISAYSQLEFIENQGQWGKEYGMKANFKHGEIWIAKNQVAFSLSDFGGQKSEKKSHVHSNPELAKEHYYTMEFVGANSDARVKGTGKKACYHNYYIGSAENWRANVPLFEEARQVDVYQGTDLIWKEEGGSLKYEFELREARNSRFIKIRYRGLDGMQIKSGKLILKTSIGTITEQAPIAYQIVDGKKRQIACHFKFVENQTIGFDFPYGFIANRPLVIDPVLIFSTFSGSRSDNWGFTATYGENGVTYSGGIVLGTRFPRTPGSFQPSFAGDSTGTNYLQTFDIGILKFNSNGSQLLYATYLGGSEAEIPASMVVDNNNNLIVLGASSSANFPTTPGAYDRTYNGGTSVSPYGPGESIVRFRQGSDIVVSKFSPNGIQLLGSTFLGGSDNEGVLSLISQGNSALVRNYGDSFRGEVAVDSLGKIYLASHTRSTNFPVVSAIQSTKGAGFDGLSARFNPNLTALEFSTFFGGNGDDGAFSIQVASPNLVYLSGGTRSTNLQRANLGLNSSNAGGTDGFVCRFNPSGGLASLRTSYIGTNSYDQAYFVQLDRMGSVYLFGQTTGEYPVTSGVYSVPNSSQFIQCLSSTLDSSLFSTVFGNGDPSLPNISPTAFLVDDCGRIYCSGWGGFINNLPDYQNGYTSGMPTTPDAYSQTTDGSDFYLIAFEKNAQALSFATFFGNNQSGTEHVDGGTSRFDKKGVVYQAVCAGCGGSSLFPTTPGVYSNTNQASNCNNAVFKYDFSLLKARFQPSVIQACAPATIHFTSLSVYATGYQWFFGDNQAISTLQDTISFLFDSAGTFPVKLVAINPDACPSKDSVFQTITIQKIPEFSGDSLAFCSFSDTLQLPSLPQGAYTYSWQPVDFLSASNTRNPKIINPQNNVIYTGTVSSSFGCQKVANFKVSNGILRAKVLADTTIGCSGLNLFVANQSYQGKQFTWYWGDGDSTESTDSLLSHVYALPGTYEMILKAQNDTTCIKQSYDTVQITILPPPFVSDTLLRFCLDSNLVLSPGLNSGVRFFWSPGNLLNDSTLNNPVFINPEAQIFNLVVENESNCRSNSKVEIRDGRLRADFTFGIPTFCTPTPVFLLNTSKNAQVSRWIWDADSAQVLGNGTIPFSATQAGRLKIRLKVLSDTACKNEDFVDRFVDLGGIPAQPTEQKYFCPGDFVAVQTLAGPGYKYDWPGFVLLDSLPNSGKIFGSDTLRFFVNIEDTLQCQGKQNFELIPSRPNSKFESINQFNLCSDLLRYQFISEDPGLNFYKWIIGDSTFSGRSIGYTFPERGNYSVKLKVNRDGCLDSSLQFININPPKLELEAKFSMREKWTNCLEVPEYIIDNQSIGAERLVWVTNGDSIVGPLTRLIPKNDGDFDLVLNVYQSGCVRSRTTKTFVQKLSPPNLISLNGDGKNDSFQILNLPDKTGIEIRNRWGSTIFSSTNYQNNWIPDGKEETVFYRLNLPEGNSCSGWIQIVK